MTKEKLLSKINELTTLINNLPKGYISKKEIGGKIYFYHQWSENGVKKSRYLKNDEFITLSKQIEKRKKAQNDLKQMKGMLVNNKPATICSNFLNVKCVLMHKNYPVIDLELDSNTGTISKIGQVHVIEHMPLGIISSKGMLSKEELNKWWMDRSIPASRSGIRDVLDALKIVNTNVLLIRCYGLSLSDQYWIRPKNSNLKWEDINFFNNEFSEDMGDILFGSLKDKKDIQFSSPDNTSNGNLKKRWKIINGERCLIKGGNNPYRQQPINEVIATKVMQHLEIPSVEYRLLWDKGIPYSVCNDFVNENTELISAWRILKSKKKQNDASLYQHFVTCAEELAIPNVVGFLDKMIVLDYLILNEDRHLNNFGALRNAESLQFIGMAPIYDSGSSLGFDKTSSLMKNKSEIICKPFKKTHEEQLELVSSFDWLDLSKLDEVPNIISSVLLDERIVDIVEEKRINTIIELAKGRVEILKRYINNKYKK